MAPSKRKASVKVEKEVKKAKVVVVEDPVEIATTKLTQAFNFDLAQELPHKVVTMVLAVLPEAMSNAVEERHPIESDFTKLVGDALEAAQKSLDEKQAATEAALEEKRVEVATLEENVVKANEVKTERESALEIATTAEQEAKEAKNTAITNLTTQQDEEAKLPETKEQLEEERTELAFALDVTRGDVPSAKDSKKLVAQLTKVGASEALVSGVPSAVGKTGGLEQMFISEACKLLEGKLAEVQAQQADWEKHTEEMATKTKELDTEVNTLTAAHEARDQELKDCKAQLKAANAAIKEAETAKKTGYKAMDKANAANEEATTAATDCRAYYATYEFLALRSLIEPEAPEEPEAPVEAPVEAAAEETPMAEAPIEETAVEAAPLEETKEEIAPAMEEVTAEGDVVSKMDVDVPEPAVPAMAADVAEAF
jgi:chromosome segregation ATPase